MIDSKQLEKLGVFTGDDGRYYHYRIRTVNVEYDPADPKAIINGAILGYDEQQVKHPVILPLATDPDSVERARKSAAASGADFYHPTEGWLRGGRKRETERPENLGAGSEIHPSRHVSVARGKKGQSHAE